MEIILGAAAPVVRRLGVLPVCSLFGFAAFAPDAHAARAPKVAVGDVPPYKLGTNEAGEELLLSAHKGKVVVVTFWATWCAPCLAELPVLEAFQREVGPGHLCIFAVNYREGSRVYRKVLKKLPDYDLTFIYDRNGRASKRYGVKGIPHMFMLGRDGKVAHVHIGYGEDSVSDRVTEFSAASP